MPATPPDVWLSRQTFERVRAPGDQEETIPKSVRDAVLRALRIEAFYRDNHDKAGDMILPKAMPDILNQMSKGTVFTCEIRSGFSRRIVAASILWEKKMLTIGPAGELAMGTYFEVGTQLSIMNGYNFQWILNAFTLISTLCLDPGPTYFSATFGDNDASKRNFIDKMHFADWSPLPNTWKCERESALKDIGQLGRGVSWFRPTLRTVRAAADLIVELTKNPERLRSKPVEQPNDDVLNAPAIRFHCEEKLLIWIRDEVQAIRQHAPQSHATLCDAIGHAISETFLQL